MYNRKDIGNGFEANISYLFHQQGIPLLVDQAILRKRDAGQIDLARISKIQNSEVIEICEVKVNSDLSFKQKMRLRRSQEFLSLILERVCTFKLMRQEKITGQR